MTQSNQNPFILPGFGQTGEAAGNPIMASMEMMRKAWQGLASGGALEGAMVAPMSVDDLERRISDLRAVETWLRMNLSMLSSTIQGLEVQRSTITTLSSFMAGAAAGASDKEGAASPFDAFWKLWQTNGANGAAEPKPAQSSASQTAAASQSAQSAAATDSANPSTTAAAGSADKTHGADAQAGQATADVPPAIAAQALAASKGWWDMVQSQFDNLATATTASMQGAEPVPPGGKAASNSSVGKSAARKTAAAKKPVARKAPAKRSSGGTTSAAKPKSTRKTAAAKS